MSYLLKIILCLLISWPVFAADKAEKDKKDYIGLDVRTTIELKINPAVGATHISMFDLDKEAVKDLPKDKTIKVFCEAGVRAGKAAKKLKQWGFTKVENIGSWREWNALEKSSKVKK